jgi:hypothetical protein
LRSDDNDRLAILKLWRDSNLVTCEQGNGAVLVELQRVPIDRNLAAAHTKEAAKVDDGGANIAVMVDDNVDYAPHVVARAAVDLAAENRLDIFVIEHGGRGLTLLLCCRRWRRFRGLCVSRDCR